MQAYKNVTRVRRIVVLREGRREPLYATGPIVPSPSPTLLVEAQCMGIGQTCTREFTSLVLTYFPSGASMRFTADGRAAQCTDIPSGGVVVSQRHVVESVEWRAPASQLSVQLDEAVLASVSESVLGSVCFQLAPGPCMLDARLGGLFEALDAERRAGYPSGRPFVDGLEQSMASYLVRHLSACDAKRQVRGGLAPVPARRLVEFMQDNLCAQVSINDLAAIARLSPSHLSRAFRVTFGMTPHEYLLQLRMAHAKALLGRGDTTLLDVAQRSGFKTQQHFSRVFRKRVGVPPGRFRDGG